MRKSVLLVLTVFLVASSMFAAQTRNPRLTGKVSDSTGAVMPGTDIRVTQGDRTVAETKTNAEGAFGVELPAGEYKVQVSAPDFKAFEQTVRVTPNMAPLNVSLSLAIVETKVEVTTQTAEVTIDAESTLTDTKITGESLKELPEDEEALLAYLQQLAQAKGAQGNASLIIDGIGGGKMPTKDQIQQIIINTNTFSATNNGGSTIEIITRPGTQKWTGSINFGFADSALDAKGAFDSTKPRKSQHAIQSSISGTLIPGRLTASFNVRTLKAESEGNSLRAVTPDGRIESGVTSPTINRNFGSSGQLYLNKINTLNFNGSLQLNRQDNQGVGGFTLAERASNRRAHQWQVQFNERAIFSPTFIHEVRFRINKSVNKNLPVTEAIAINVLDAFNGGGAQSRNDSTQTNFNWGNNVRYQFNPKWNVQAGTEFSYGKNHNVSESNYLGAFTFSSLDDYIARRPVQFRKTIITDPLVEVSQLEFNTFLQADWRLNPKAQLGLGLRYQAQTNLSDYNNLGPTVQLSYQATKNTVLRFGIRQQFGNFGVGNTEQLIRQDGRTRQTDIVILNPDYNNPLAGTSTTPGSSSGSIRVRDPKLEAPHQWNSQFSLDQSFAKTWRAGVSFNANRSQHNIRSRNINAPYPGTALPEELLTRLRSLNSAVQTAARAEVDHMRPLYPYIGNVYQYESTGNNNGRNLQFRLQPPSNLAFFRKKIGLQGQIQYSINWRNDDNSAVNQYDWTEWARSGNRHSVFATMSLRLPRGWTANFPFDWSSGSYYSITTGKDENGDQSTNDRPAGIKRNSEVGPSRYNIDMSLNKTFNLKPTRPTPRPANLAPPGQQVIVPPNGGAPINIQNVNAASLPPQLQEALARAQANGGVQPQQQVPYTGPRMNLSIQVRNLINNTQLYSYSGVLTSPYFGQSTGASQARSIRGTVTFSWQ